MWLGWTTELHWRSGDSPKWFYCKRLTDGHTSYFPPDPDPQKRYIGTWWEPEQQWFQPESREWCGYVLGNYVWAPGDGAWAPRSIMNSSALVSVAESVLGTAGVQTRRRVAIEPELYTTTTAAGPDPLLASSDWC